jgi:hypothetical protein
MVRRSFVIALLVTGALLVPAAVYAAHRFNDVPNNHTFHEAIGWMADNGITLGCNPPANTNYCPDDNVTRGQMAAFLRRLAESGVVEPGDPLVQALPGNVWTPLGPGTGPTTSNFFGMAAAFSGDGAIQASTITPVSLGDVSYGLDQIEICYQGSGGGFINTLLVVRHDLSSIVGTAMREDGTNRTATTHGCYDVNVDALAGRGYTYLMALAGGGNIVLTSITETWTTDVAGFATLDQQGDPLPDEFGLPELLEG